MLVKINTSLVSGDRAFNYGEEIDSVEFSEAVGSGWESLCDEVAVKPPAPEVAVAVRDIETADLAGPIETTSKGRRK
jgi:hypothetical protein